MIYCKGTFALRFWRVAWVMAEADFDIGSLAAFLHILPAQVAKLADRGKLPGRKVAGQWRFSRAEIHHWLEQRIGISDDHQLLQMEEMLHESARQSADQPVAVRRAAGGRRPWPCRSTPARAAAPFGDDSARCANRTPLGPGQDGQCGPRP